MFIKPNSSAKLFKLQGSLNRPIKPSLAVGFTMFFSTLVFTAFLHSKRKITMLNQWLKDVTARYTPMDRARPYNLHKYAIYRLSYTSQ